MKLSRVTVSNFRCLKDVEIRFEPDLTVIVGENDSGKSSLFDILRIIFEGGLPEAGDFYLDSPEINCELEFDNERRWRIEFRKNDEGQITRALKAIVCWGDLKEYLQDPDRIDTLDLDEKKQILGRYGRPSRKRTPDSVKEDFVALIRDNREKIEIGENEEVDIEKLEGIPEFLLVDAKRFDNINDFVRDVYLKEDLRRIWCVRVETGGAQRTLSDVFQDSIREIEERKQAEVNNEVLPKLQEFLPSLRKVVISIQHQPYDVTKSVTVTVGFEDSEGKEVSAAKKGDGTKRRTTLALLRHKAEKGQAVGDKLFLFDEPDTHLHVRAQRELTDVLEQIARDNQVLITTHSPFILNSVHPSKVRLLRLTNGISNVKSLVSNDDVECVLRSLGIENTHLFFTRKILIVEGESEQVAIPILFEKYREKNLHNQLVSIFNVKGREGMPHLARVIKELMADVPITVLVDSDLAFRPRTKALLEHLAQYAQVRRFEIGCKEFEDAFDDEVIYEAVLTYCEAAEEKWTKEAIEENRRRLLQNPQYKFGDALAKLADTDKIAIAEAIARYCPAEKIPQKLKELFDSLAELC